MKKHLLFIFAALMPLLASAHDFEVNGIYYNISSETDKTAEVTFEGDRYNSYDDEYSGSITIPATVTYEDVAYSVTSIGERAFSYCSSLTAITLPESLTSIGNSAFYDCRSLTAITIPEGVTSIGGSAFSGCSSLTAINIPEDVTSIGNRAFYNCSSLTTITIPESVTSIGWQAFSGCSSLTAILVAEENKVYDSRSGCNAIIETASNTLIAGCSTTIIPESVTSIGDDAFSGCSSLTAINIPEGVTSIGSYAFYNCSSLTSITIPESVTSIGNSAFSGCSSLTAINIPEGVTSIGNRAFYNCSSLTTITLPEGVTSIGESAFSGCSSLTSITIPEGVTSIGDEAFSGCSSLERVAINCAKVSNWFAGRSSIKEIVLGEGVTGIGYEAFYYCISLTAITIPTSVTSIGRSAFSSCRSLTAITIPESVKSIEDYAFNGCYFTHENFINNSTCTSSDNWGATLCDKEYDGIFVQEEKVILCRPSVTSATIPEGMTSIGSYAFAYCTNLKELTLGKGLKKITAGAFTDCTALEKITIHATQPPRIEGEGNALFSDATYESATLYVPQGSISKYQVMTGWSGFYNISEMEGSTPDYLTLRQADNGEVGIAVDLGRTYKVRITPSTGWKIHTVTFDGKDMTAQLAADNTFTTPTINGSAVLNVAYVKEGSAIAAATASRIKVQGHQGTISIAGAAEGAAIGLYTTSGTLVATATAEGDTTHLTVPTGQVYIVKVADTVVKIGM